MSDVAPANGHRVTVTADVRVPWVPNFLQAGGTTIPLDAISDDDLRRLGDAWTLALIARAEEMRAGRKGAEQDG